MSLTRKFAAVGTGLAVAVGAWNGYQQIQRTDTAATYSAQPETSVALIGCVDPASMPRSNRVGSIAIEFSCISDDLEIQNPSGVKIEEEFLSKSNRLGKYVLTWPARCLNADQMRDGLFVVTPLQDDQCSELPKNLYAIPATLARVG